MLTTTNTLHIRMFGGFEVIRGEETLRFETRKTAALLAFLAYFADRAHSRDRLVEELWPGCDPEPGLKRLRQTIARLRGSLVSPGDPSAGIRMVPGRTDVRIAPGTSTSDVEAFRAAVARARVATDADSRREALEQAAALYSGPLLPDFDEAWIAAERASLGDAQYEVLRQLSRARAAAGDAAGAIEAARKGVQIDPLREGAYFDLMKLYAAANRAADALKQYTELEQVLGELRVRPSQRIRDLAEQIGSGAHKTVGDYPPQAAALHARPTLPAPRTRFFGREEELERLEGFLLGEGGSDMSMSPPPGGPWASRLITLTGAGGCGKTRLALEIAHRVVARAHRRAYFVPLADVADQAGILQAILEALGAGRKPTEAPMARVVEALRQQPVLLILDNFEQLVEAGALLVGMLLDSVPGLACLVTSRQRLDLEGEREWPVHPLEAPALDGAPQRLLEFPSVQLFVDRAQAIRPTFELTEENGDAVARICRRLDGIPLAVELAAAQADLLTPQQMLAFLEAGRSMMDSRWPASRRRDAPARHATLEAAVDWSYRLLSPGQQRFFRRLCVFSGGWHPAAAGAVCLGGVGEVEALDALEELRARSLVYTEEEKGLARFHMLQVLRDYARSHIDAHEWEEISARHAAYFLALAEEAGLRLRGPDQVLWLDRLRLEEPNLLAALDRFTLDSEDGAERELRLAGALSLLWWVDRRTVQGLERVTGALSRADSSRRTRARAEALLAATRLARQAEREEAQAFAAEGLAISGELGWRQGQAQCFIQLGLIHFQKRDRARAIQYEEKALAVARALDDPGLVASALNSLAVARDVGAEPLFEESLLYWRRAGDRIGLTGPLFHLGGRAAAAGDYDVARRYHEEQAAVAREVGDHVGAAQALALLGQDLHALSDAEAARSTLEASLVLRRRLQDPLDIAHSLCLLGDVLADGGDIATAERYYRDSIPVAVEKDAPWLTAHGLAGLAALAERAGDFEHAAGLAAAARRMTPGTTPHAWLLTRIDHALRESERALGRVAFEAVSRRAAAMSPEDLLRWSQQPEPLAARGSRRAPAPRKRTRPSP